MPTYDYLCDKCGHQFEKFQPITANSLKKCPQCGKMALNRLIGSGSGIIFKGSGFYQTDYRSKSYDEGKNNSKPKTETETKSTDKKETKSPDKPKKDSAPADRKNKK